MNLRDELYPHPIITTAIAIKNKQHITQIFKEFLIRYGINIHEAIRCWKLVFINNNYITHGCSKYPISCKYFTTCNYSEACIKAHNYKPY